MPASEDRTCEAAAAEWLAALQLGTADEVAFEAWRAESPHHAVAFARLAATWQAIDVSHPVPVPSRTGVSRRAWLEGATAASVMAITGVGFWAHDANARDRAETGVGESRRIAVASGIWLMLNTDSAVAWRIRSDHRVLWLERGEVGIESAGAPLRLRREGQELLLAPGRYNVACTIEGLDLLVLKGRVDAPGARPALPRQQIRLRGARAETAPAPDAQIEAAIAWPLGEVAFEDVSLAEAVHEYNRYLTRKLVLAEPALGELRVGGRFYSHDPHRFLEALELSLNIRAMPGPNQILLASKKSCFKEAGPASRRI